MSPSGHGTLLISFEGIDGCGKSTLLAKMSDWLHAAAIPHLVTREPGGTKVGDALRSVVLDPSFSGMHPWTEALIYAAGRAQHVIEVILPALEQGRWVLTDRFADATLAYQGYGRGLDIPLLRALHRQSTGDIRPGLTFLLDCRVETAMQRRGIRRDGPDRVEGQDAAFHERVRAGYLELAAAEPQRFLTLDADRPIEEVAEDLRASVRLRLGLNL